MKTQALVIALVMALFFAGPNVSAQAPQTDQSIPSKVPQNAAALKDMTRAGEIIGKTVTNRNGQDVGRVHDIVLDAEGKVAYAIIGYGGVMGVGDKLVPMPWQLFKNSLNPGTDRIIADISRQSLEQAPHFEDSKWPNLAESEWVQKIYNYFGVNNSKRSGDHVQSQ